MQGRRICPPRQRRERRPWTPAHFLWLLALPGLRLHHPLHAHRRTLPEVRRAVHRCETLKDWHGARLPKGRLRLGETRARGAARSATRRSSRAGGGQVLSPLAPENILLKFTFSHRRRTYTVRKALLVGRPK